MTEDTIVLGEDYLQKSRDELSDRERATADQLPAAPDGSYADRFTLLDD